MLKTVMYFLYAMLIALLSTSASAELLISDYSLVAKNSGKCLAIGAGSQSYGAEALQWSCLNLVDQQWSLKPYQDAYQVVSKNSGQCLNVQYGSTSDDATVIQWPCGGTNNELWYAKPAGDSYQLVAKHSGKCLNVLNSSVNDGASIKQTTCTGGSNEQWKVPQLVQTAIQSKQTKLCLDVLGASPNKEAAVGQWACMGANNQQWALKPYQDAYQLVVKHSGQCLNVQYGSTSDGAAVIQWPCVGANNELWYAKPTGDSYQLVAKHSGKCLNASANNANPVQSSCTGASNQLWQINPTAYTLSVNKAESRGVWEGWGAGLSWWANGVGGSSYQDTYADLVFTQKNVAFAGKTLPGLGFNLARYNIGGGGHPTDNINGTTDQIPSWFPWYKDIDGYWKDWFSNNPASTSWDWYRDGNQLQMMWAARDRGAKFEFFADAPMWWMTYEKSSAGGALQPWNRRDYALYAASVVKQAQTNWGVNVDSVEVFNEPSAGWWTYPIGQQGANVSLDAQTEILGYLREELNKRQLSQVKIAAADENTMSQGLATYEFYKSQSVNVSGVSTNVANLVDKVNVHGYYGLEPWRDDNVRAQLRASVGQKRIWLTEYGDNDGSGMTLAQTIMSDLSYLRPTAWLYWQPVEPYSAWGLVNAQYKDAADQFSAARATPTDIYNKYFVFAQFSRFLRPGYQIIGNNDHNSVAAYDAQAKRLVIITVNYYTPQNIYYDLTGLTNISTTTANITFTNANGTNQLVQVQRPIGLKKLMVDAEANSIYSIVIDGVDL